MKAIKCDKYPGKILLMVTHRHLFQTILRSLSIMDSQEVEEGFLLTPVSYQTLYGCSGGIFNLPYTNKTKLIRGNNETTIDKIPQKENNYDEMEKSWINFYEKKNEEEDDIIHDVESEHNSTISQQSTTDRSSRHQKVDKSVQTDERAGYIRVDASTQTGLLDNKEFELDDGEVIPYQDDKKAVTEDKNLIEDHLSEQSTSQADVETFVAEHNDIKQHSSSDQQSLVSGISRFSEVYWRRRLIECML